MLDPVRHVSRLQVKEWRDYVAAFLICCLVLWVGTCLFFYMDGPYYVKHDDTGKIDSISIVVTTGGGTVNDFDASSQPDARAACTKKPPPFLVLPIKFFRSDTPCYHQ
jgi:hypothetical protein